MRRSSFSASLHPIAIILMAASLVLFDADVTHAAYPSYEHYDYPIDFALTLSNSDIDLRDGDMHYIVDLNRINISVFTLEERNIQFGFNAGSSYLSLDNDPVLTGIHLSGYHAGFSVKGQNGKNPQLGFRTDYRYQETQDETEAQLATLSWHEWSMAITGKILFGQRLALTLGGAISEINARRSVRGDTNDAINMRLDSAAHAQAELAWLTGTGGQVSIALQKGAHEYFAFKFSQTFK